MISRVVVFHHPHSESAASFSAQLAKELERRGVDAFVADAWEQAASARVEHSDLAICVGGDGTVLRCARVLVPHAVPILGVNMGRLGFLTDLSPRDIFTRIESIVAREWRVEERLMVRADVYDADSRLLGVYHALNDIVVSRPSPGRPVYVDVRIDGARVAIYRCDGIIVATPTGSTGYSLAAGGPILAPTEHHLVVTPVSAHLALGRSLVLQPDTTVDLLVVSDHGGVLSVDGQDDLPLVAGARVVCHSSEHVTRFARFREPSTFFAELAEKLESQLSSPMNHGT
jgi:NAD+ kinase